MLQLCMYMNPNDMHQNGVLLSTTMQGTYFHNGMETSTQTLTLPVTLKCKLHDT